jgi:glutamate racemase
LTTIGVFDSGVGGLSVLRALLVEIPEARFVYVADSAHAPYGARSPIAVVDRALRITQQLRSDHAIDALVVACNTATAHAIDAVRAQPPGLPVVGVEPALKPAAALTRTGHVGVLATHGTVHSERFHRLRTSVEADATRRVHFSVQACNGLADAIECFDETETRRLCEQYLATLRAPARGLPPIDTLVLGCTHYPFAAHLLTELCGPAVTLVETGTPVARRTRTVLSLGPPTPGTPEPTPLLLLSSGPTTALSQAAERWLSRSASADAWAISPAAQTIG